MRYIIRKVVGRRVYLINLDRQGYVHWVKVRETRPWIYGMERHEQHTIWHVGTHGPRGRRLRETTKVYLALKDMGYEDPAAFLARPHTIIRRIAK
jgi:hypothetical protein